MRIASLNVQNLRLLPDAGGGHLHGARDRDEAANPAHDAADRQLTAQLIAATDADIVALQEVFDAESLDAFHDRCLAPLGRVYPHRLCLPGNDGRGLDVAVMARRRWDAAQSHAQLTPRDVGLDRPEGMPPDQPIFRRDCLELRFGALTLFVLHFKAPTPDPARARALRRLEAEAVVRLLPRGCDALWLVAGDLNEPERGEGRAIAPLEASGVDLGLRLPEAARWTYYDPHSDRHQRPDRMIASPALAARYPEAVPEILRRGLGHEAGPGQGARLERVGLHRPHASDHAALLLDLPGL